VAIVLENTQSKGQAWTWTKTGEPACLITISCSVHAVKTMSRRDRTPGARLADTKRRFNGLLNFQKNCILECLSNEPDRFVRGRGAHVGSRSNCGNDLATPATAPPNR